MRSRKARILPGVRLALALFALVMTGLVGASLLHATDVQPQDDTGPVQHAARPDGTPTKALSLALPWSDAIVSTHIATRAPGIAGALDAGGEADLNDKLGAYKAASSATALAVARYTAKQAATRSAVQTSIAVGSEATPYADLQTSAQGFAFVPAPTPKAAQATWIVDAELASVAGSAPNDVWAVGHTEGRDGGQEEPLIEHWDGYHWSSVTASSSEGYGSRLLGVSVLTRDDAWLVGSEVTSYSYSHALAEHWNGSDWEKVTTPGVAGRSIFLAISGLAPDDYWAVGSQSPSGNLDVPLIEHWDGRLWNTVQSPDVEAGELSGVAALASDNVWAVGEYVPTLGNAARPHALIEHWDGSQWAIVSNPTFGAQNFDTSHLQAVSAGSGSDLWAVGWGSFNDPNGEQGLIDHWDGKQWNIMPGPSSMYQRPYGVGGYVLEGVSARSATDVWAVGFYGPQFNSPWITLAEHWDGSHWSLVSTPNAQPGKEENGLVAVSTTRADDIWAVGEYGNYEGDSDIKMLTAHYAGSVPSRLVDNSLFSVLTKMLSP